MDKWKLERTSLTCSGSRGETVRDRPVTGGAGMLGLYVVQALVESRDGRPGYSEVYGTRPNSWSIPSNGVCVGWLATFRISDRCTVRSRALT